MAAVGFSLGNLNGVLGAAKGRGVETLLNEFSSRLNPAIVYLEDTRTMGEAAKAATGNSAGGHAARADASASRPRRGMAQRGGTPLGARALGVCDEADRGIHDRRRSRARYA